jgi:hypothetical protein
MASTAAAISGLLGMTTTTLLQVPTLLLGSLRLNVTLIAVSSRVHSPCTTAGERERMNGMIALARTVRRGAATLVLCCAVASAAGAVPNELAATPRAAPGGTWVAAADPVNAVAGCHCTSEDTDAH